MNKLLANKKVLAGTMGLLMIGLVLGAVLFESSLHVNLSVNEPISHTTIPTVNSVALNPNQEYDLGTFTVSNSASVSEPAVISWVADQSMTATQYDVLVSVDGGAFTSLVSGSDSISVPTAGSVVDVKVVYHGTVSTDTIVGDVMVHGTLSA